MTSQILPMRPNKHVDTTRKWGDADTPHRPIHHRVLMSKTRTAEPYVQQKVSLPATLMARFQALHWDPVLQKPKYGAISEVLTKLLSGYVNAMESGTDPLAQQDLGKL